jgi:hypothetical protein
MVTVELYGRRNNVLKCLSGKTDTVVMVNHDRLLCVVDSGSPSMGYQPMHILALDRAQELWLAAHLAREDVSVYTADHVRNEKSSTEVATTNFKFFKRLTELVGTILPLIIFNGSIWLCSALGQLADSGPRL